MLTKLVNLWPASRLDEFMPRAWVRGFWKAMALAPETWSKLAEDERCQRAAESPHFWACKIPHLAGLVINR